MVRICTCVTDLTIKNSLEHSIKVSTSFHKSLEKPWICANGFGSLRIWVIEPHLGL